MSVYADIMYWEPNCQPTAMTKTPVIRMSMRCPYTRCTIRTWECDGKGTRSDGTWRRSVVSDM